MRWPILLATLLVLSISAWAQRGGGHGASGGGHMGSGPHMASGAHVSSGSFSHGGSTGWNAAGRGGHVGYGQGGYGYGYRGTARYYRQIPYLWGLYPNYYSPFGYDDSGYYSGTGPDYSSGYGDPNGPGYDPYPPGPDPETAYLSSQVEQLSNQLSAVEQQGPPPMAAQGASAAPVKPITLVLKDGRRLQVQNYAVMDQTFWDFTSQPVKKILLANINVAESQRESAANGADFPNLTAPGGSGQ